nr:transposase [Natrialba sp. INN-245]
MRGLLLCTAETKFQFRELEDCFGSVLGRLICKPVDETPVLSTIWEFWNRVQPFIQRLFDHFVQLLDELGFYGSRFVFDSTHLECPRTVGIGAWAWDSIDQTWVYGYGLLVAVDCASDLPAGAVVTQRKQHPETATLECFDRLRVNTTVTEVLGDSAYDTLEFHKGCIDYETLPICTYNPRNTAEPLDIVFRVEALAEEHDVQLDHDALRAAGSKEMHES